MTVENRENSGESDPIWGKPGGLDEYDSEEEDELDELDEEDEEAEEQEAKQKAATKIVKKMGDKGRYDDANQMKTLVVMQVLGDTKSFFDNQAQLQDTPGFFDNTKVPDAQISDNNMAAYFMIGGSDIAMDALTDLQYR